MEIRDIDGQNPVDYAIQNDIDSKIFLPDDSDQINQIIN